MQNKEEKKDWKVTLSYDVRHKDTYLITNQTEKDAIYIAENQNQSSECICIKEDEEDIDPDDLDDNGYLKNSFLAADDESVGKEEDSDEEKEQCGISIG